MNSPDKVQEAHQFLEPVSANDSGHINNSMTLLVPTPEVSQDRGGI